MPEQMNQPANNEAKRILVLIFIALLVLAIVILGIIFAPQIIKLFRQGEKLKSIILNTGIWAPLVMIGLQAVQVIITPLPGNVTGFISGYIFGAVKGTIFSMTGVIIGSCLAFLIARLLGRRFLRFLIPEEKLNRFDKFIIQKGPFVLFLLLIVPNPIGDVAYYLAGLTSIPLLFFLVLVLIGRLPSNVVNNLIGAKVTTFSQSDWIIFGVVILIIIVVYYLNRKRIEGFFLKIADRQNLKQVKKELE